MKLTEYDLRQIDEKYIHSLPEDQLRELALNLLSKTKELMDRANQNSSNSSIPPSKETPWSQGNRDFDECDAEASEQQQNAGNSDNTNKIDGNDRSKKQTDDAENPENTDQPAKKKPGKQPGAQGYGRKVELPVTHTQNHFPSHCAGCNAQLNDNDPRVAITGLYVLDIETPKNNAGICTSHTKHTYYETTCRCGHKTRVLPERCAQKSQWSVELTEWHLCGPLLISLIVCLSKRFHMSRRSIQEFLNDWLGIKLSKGVINQCILEAGRAVEPLEEQLIDEIKKATLIHIDETGWKQRSKKLWLWGFVTTTVCLFLIDSRTKKVAKTILDIFTGWVMSDGYHAYRHYQKRLRCWAHLIRKLTGLDDSVDKTAQAFGKQGLECFKILKAAVYVAREGPNTDISQEFADLLAQFKALCSEHQQCRHEKTQAVAREFLNDWQAIWCVLSDVRLPMTNNEAEQILRHWVIDRQITFGTRSAEGSRAFALLASVIETCRLRGVSPWPYLAEVIAARRKNNSAPPLPVASTV